MPEYVVFDNNAYKRLSPERLTRIVAAEKSRGIIALASMAVSQELLARVRDLDDQERGRNRSAIRKMAEHCRTQRGERPVINFVSHTDLQVYRLLTGQQHPADRDLFDHAGELIGRVNDATTTDTLADIAGELDAIEKHVARVEAGYVARLARVADGDSSSERNTMKRNLEYAAEIVHRTEEQYAVVFDATHVATILVEVMKFTSVAFTLRDAVVAEVSKKKGGHGQHHNTVWDEEVVAATSMYTTVDGGKVIVVTEEQRLLDAATKAGARDGILSLSDYERLLAIPDAAAAT